MPSRRILVLGVMLIAGCASTPNPDQANHDYMYSRIIRRGGKVRSSEVICPRAQFEGRALEKIDSQELRRYMEKRVCYQRIEVVQSNGSTQAMHRGEPKLRNLVKIFRPLAHVVATSKTGILYRND